MDGEKRGLIVANVIFAMALVVVVIPLLWIAKYNYPSADDWSYATLGYHALKNGEGLFGVIRAAAVTSMHYYVSWEGRFCNSFLAALQPGIWGERYYGIVGWIMIGSVILSEFYLCGSLLKKYAKDRGKWLCAPIMVPTLILQLLYVPAEESFYWYTGSVNYTFVYALSLILLALFMKLGTGEHKNGGARFGLAVLACLLAVVVGGDNYSTSLSCLLTLLVLSALFFFFDRRAFYRTWFVPALMGICLLLCAAAPGNTVRLHANFGGATAGKMEAIIDSLEYALRAVCAEIADGKTALMLLLILPFLWRAVKAMDCDFRFPLLFTAVTFGLYASQATPAMYVERGIYAKRLMAILFYSRHVWIVGNAGYWLGWISGKKLENKCKASAAVARIRDRLGGCLWAYSILMGLAFVAMIRKSGSNSFDAYWSLKQGRPQQYAKEWDERLEVLRDDSVKEVCFPPISVYPAMIMNADLQPEWANVWINAACAEYYGKDEVRILSVDSD